ncbi:DUF2946 domain-containing protein [Janthinobacterium sp. Mn2066]|uniref:DUF2946 domain-containing protein n=1 Tax=Janthinobacterium sp. Mn2066 TaxID=3395264 RepID=UPI003BE148EE
MGYFKTRTAARKRWQWWFACLAILLNVLSPSLSYAFASQHINANTAAIEICSASGTVYTQADLAPRSKSTTDSVLHHIQHCPFCMGHAGSLGLPPASLPLALITGHDVYPPLFYQAPQPQFAWLDAQPRGPPRLS